MTNLKLLDRSLNKTKGNEINFASLSQLFSGYIILSKDSVLDIGELENRIFNVGKSVGARLYELCLWRDKSSKKENQFLNILFYLTNNFWKFICGHSADSLERSTEDENQYMIFDNDPLISKFISAPKDFQSLNCAIFYGGMIEAILSSNGYKSKISAHSVPTSEYPNRTVFLVKNY